jgi:hypothetical protein
MENKKRFSILKALIVIICIILIAASLAINILFSGNKVPHFFGRYFYVVDTESTGEGVTPGALIIAGTPDESQPVVGDIVLCYTDEESTELQLRGICEVVVGEDGQNKYSIGVGTAPQVDENGDRVTITKDKIAAVCTGNPQSLDLGRYIRFSSNIKGILLLLILPCVILVILLITKIASSSSDEDEGNGEFDFYEYDEEEAARSAAAPPSHEKQSGPLFEPSQEIQPSNEFERKKMSIAENFSQKEVDHNSSYQKEKERTMQFKTQRGGTSAAESPSANYRARHQSSSAESSFAARNMSGQSTTAPTADALREEMLRKTAEAERGGAYNTKTYGISSDSSSDITGIYSKAQLAEMARSETPKRRTTSTVAVKKSSSPNIDDIITRSSVEAKKKSSSAMSVDDLLKIIEDEKKKL